MTSFKASTKPLVSGIIPNGHITKVRLIKCPVRDKCSKVDYCLLFSSAPVGGTVYFKCPKRACVDKEFVAAKS